MGRTVPAWEREEGSGPGEARAGGPASLVRVPASAKCLGKLLDGCKHLQHAQIKRKSLDSLADKGHPLVSCGRHHTALQMWAQPREICAHSSGQWKPGAEESAGPDPSDASLPGVEAVLFTRVFTSPPLVGVCVQIPLFL